MNKKDKLSSINLSFLVSKLLFEKSEWGSGVDLSLMMFDSLGDVYKNENWSYEYKVKVNQLISLCTNQNNWRKKLIDSALSLSLFYFALAVYVLSWHILLRIGIIQCLLIYPQVIPIFYSMLVNYTLKVLCFFSYIFTLNDNYIQSNIINYLNII